MITRSREKTLTFTRPFLLKDIGRELPPGDYRVVTDEELIEGLSFPVYRRVSTMMFVPGLPPRTSSIEMVPVDPAQLQAVVEKDTAPNLTPIRTPVGGVA